MPNQSIRSFMCAGLLSAAVLLSAACTPHEAPEPPPAAAPVETTTAPAADSDSHEAPMTCRAEAVQSLVGQAATEAVVAQATADSGSASVRVLGPDDAATMDFREDRLNIHTDATGVIERIDCG